MSVSCSICQEDVRFSDEEISVLNCGHLFHHKCLQRWFATDFSCPECRSEVARNEFVKKIYPSINEDADLTYRGSSEEIKTILKVFNENNANFQKFFLKRIAFLENENKDLAKKNFKLEENLNITSNEMRSLQNVNNYKNEKINKLINDNEKLKTDIKTLQNNFKKMSKVSQILKQSNSKDLEAENNQLKSKLSSVLDILLSDNRLNDDQSKNTS